MPKLTDEKIAAAKAANPDRELVILGDDRNGDEYMFLVPDKLQYEAYQAMAYDDKKAPYAYAYLLDRCAVDPVEFSAVLLRQPGFAVSFGVPLVRAAGQGIAVTVKKA